MKNNKKGFTLIEMMIVIAIVAVLVSVIIPVLKGSSDRAAAATNAANLRSVEGQLVSMMLSDPEAMDSFEKAMTQAQIDRDQASHEQSIQDIETLQGLIEDEEETMRLTEAAIDTADKTLDLLGTVISVGGLGEPSTWNDDTIAADRATHKCNWKCSVLAGTAGRLGLGISCSVDAKQLYVNTDKTLQNKEAIKTATQKKLDEYNAQLEVLQGDHAGALDQLAKDEYEMYLYTATDGKITLENGTIIECPLAKKVNIDDVNVEEGTVMVIYLNTGTYEFTAEYDVFDKFDFARVAEDK